ncbi:hypothetical protein BZA77DRAFT_317557 [Pyronema omphalodes]|nr:hypothetical protein BZA77DRAFT_317557 [Pyronema omphalodes]
MAVPNSQIPRTAGGPPKNRMPALIGGALLAGAGYYFYTAGGDPKVAKKAAEHDAVRATASIRDELPGHGKEMQKSAEESMARVGSTVGHAIDRAERTVDKSVEEGKQRIYEGVEKLDSARKEVRTDVLRKVDEFDKKVEEEARKAKSGIMSWFGK